MRKKYNREIALGLIFKQTMVVPEYTEASDPGTPIDHSSAIITSPSFENSDEFPSSEGW